MSVCHAAAWAEEGGCLRSFGAPFCNVGVYVVVVRMPWKKRQRFAEADVPRDEPLHIVDSDLVNEIVPLEPSHTGHLETEPLGYEFSPHEFADDGSHDEPNLHDETHDYVSNSFSQDSFSVVDEEPTGSTLDILSSQLFVGHAIVTNTQVCNITMPWEVGSSTQIFGPVDHDAVPRMLPFLSTETGLNQSDHQTGLVIEQDGLHGQEVFAKVISSREDISFMQTRAKLFEAGVMKWWTILQTCPDSHQLMEQLQGKLGSGRDDAALEIIAATLGTRSPFTVVKRANALQKR